MSDRVWFYLDESGPFEDRQRGDYWPVSVVGGLISRHELTNSAMRPVLDKIEAYGNHGLRDQHLHARELRDQLGKHYDDWMMHTFRCISQLGDDVGAVCFRSTERLTLGDTDTNYLNVLVEGLVRVIPMLQEKARGPLHVTVVLENRRVTGAGVEGGHLRPSHETGATGEWEKDYLGKGDRSVPRTYVALEDYATRLRTRLLVELTRRGLTRQLQLLRHLTIRISDPATDKALNYADFVSHHARYSDRGTDAVIYKKSLADKMEYDISLVLHSGFEAATRKVDEHHYGSALFDLVEVMQETDSDLVRAQAVEMVQKVMDALAGAPAALVARHIDEYFEAVEDLDLLDPGADSDGPDNPRAYLQALDVWGRNALRGRGFAPDDATVPVDTIVRHKTEGVVGNDRSPRSNAWAFAWRWGLFRAHSELLRLANHAGDVAAGEKAIMAAEPLVALFARSVDHQPEVFRFLLRMCRQEILAGHADTALPRLDALVAFHHDTEDWWAVDLPRVLPALGDKLDRDSILCRPLGQALHVRASARLSLAWPSHGPLDSDEGVKAAISDMELALGEFAFPSDRYDVKTDLSVMHSLAGDADQALRWLASSLAGRTDAMMERAAKGDKDLLTALADGVEAEYEATQGAVALLELLVRVSDEKSLAAKTYCSAWRKVLKADDVAAVCTRVGELVVGARMRQLVLLRARGRCLGAWAGKAGPGPALDLLNRAAGMCRSAGDKETSLNWLALGCALDAAALSKKPADSMQNATAVISTLLRTLPASKPLSQLADDVRAAAKGAKPAELKALADRVFTW
ncbi:MAG: hypothetical protein AB7K09_00565 [Planctomycetota bacterium]